MKFRCVLPALALCFGAYLGTASIADAAIKNVPIDYEADGTKLKGELYYDDATSSRRPGVLVVHEWWGLNDHARTSARRLAEEGYVAMALDMFGEGKATQHPEEAKAFVAEATREASVAAGRFRAALKVLVSQPQTDPERVAAIGYCFGGAVVLNMARMGTELDGVASFHGSLAPTGITAKEGGIKAKILVNHGAADPMIPIDVVAKFAAEMETAQAHYQINIYGGAKHSFTNPEADKRNIPGLAYDANADRRSWQAMLAFLKEVFASK